MLLVRLDGKQIPEHCTLLRSELRRVRARVKKLLALLWGHLPQLLEGMANRLLAVRRHLAKRLRGSADFLSLCRR